MLFLTRLSLFFILCLVSIGIVFVQPVSAGVFGISPGKIEMESLPNKSHDLVFSIVRSNPASDERLRVSVKDEDKNMIELLGGETILMEKGRESIQYPFRLHTTALKIGQTYTPLITFEADSKEFDESLSGNGIKVGIAGKVELKIVEVLTPVILPRDFSKETIIPKDVFPKKLQVSGGKNELEKQVSWELVNNLEDVIQFIPYSLDVYQNNVRQSSLKGSVATQVSAKQSFLGTNTQTFMRPGVYTIVLTVGDHVLKKNVWVFDWWFGTKPFFLGMYFPGVCFVLGVVLLITSYFTKQKRFVFRSLRVGAMLFFFAVITWILFSYGSFVKLQTVSVSEMSLQKNAFIIQKENGEHQFWNLQNGKVLKLNGGWNILAASDTTFLAFPMNTKKDSSEKLFFYALSQEGIMKGNLADLPGVVDRAEMNTKQSYLLLSGVTKYQKPFFCIIEVSGPRAMQCDMLPLLNGQQAEDAYFIQNSSHEILVKTNQSTWVYDIWSRGYKTSHETFKQNRISEIQKNLLIQPYIKNLFGFLHLKEASLLVFWKSVFVAVENGLYLERVKQGDEEDVFLVHPQKKQRAWIARVKNGDQIYFLKNGMSITTP